MGFYQDQIVPLLINLAMRRRDLAAYRSRIVPAADGRVLEIGVGSGLNLPFYSRNVERLIGLDPSPKLKSGNEPFGSCLPHQRGACGPHFVSRRGIRALGRPRHGIRKALSGLRGRLLKLGQNREIRFRTRDILTDVANLVGGCRAGRISDRSSRQDSAQVRMPSRTSEE